MSEQITISTATLKRVLWAVVAAVVVAGVVYAGFVFLRPADPFAGVVDEDRLQAVFLEDGNVFFGRLSVANRDFYLLEDAAFVHQVPGEEEGDPPVPQVADRTGELHSPEPRMLIAKDKVVLIENLEEESDLARSIEGARAE